MNNKFLLAALMGLAATFGAHAVDTAKPILTVTLPTKSTLTSSNNFTASGKALDKFAVAGVFYQLNGGNWNAVDTTNNWTNWTANLSLLPGTNVFSAYAVDTSTNSSATNNVRFFYVVTTPLTVRTNGKGSISPNYNNALLRIGQNYTLTATPAVGFVFTNWTDDEDHVVTNKPALRFRMAEDLTFTANFVDVSKPVLTVTTPTGTTSATSSFFTASGKATDNAVVTGVYYQLNGGDWSPANTTNGWMTWSAVLNLTPGTNVLAVYAADNSANRTATNTLRFVYLTAPTTLNGWVATVTPDGVPSFAVAFGANTFSQISPHTNNFNGVGNYTFTRKSPSTVQLKFTYTAPPSITNTPAQTIDLAFSAPGIARFTNNVSGDTGELIFSTTPNLVMSSITGKAVVAVGSEGQGIGAYFSNGKYTSVDLITRATTDGSSYSYGIYSRNVSLFRLTDTQGTTFILANFLGTNYGVYTSEDYGVAGNFLGTDYGVFGFASQRPGGNAPTNIVQRSLRILSAGGEFNLSFRTNTFGQASLTTNFDNAVGNYTYARTDTNHAQLNLAYTAPPTVSGATDSARLTFFADNLGIFTNGDGTISAAVLSFITNRVPDSLGSQTLTTTNDGGTVSQQFQFANDGTFTLSGANAASGNYSYSIYSRQVSLVQLMFTGGNLAGGSSWLQLNYRSVGAGNYFISSFDSGDVLQETDQGSFSQP